MSSDPAVQGHRGFPGGHAIHPLDLPARPISQSPTQEAPTPLGTDLDLSEHDTVRSAIPPRPEPGGQLEGPPDGRDFFLPARTHNGLPTILTTKEPVVTLTRVQSGLGALTVQAVISDSVGDLRLGCAYQLVSGQSSVIHLGSGLRVAPAGSLRPVIRAGSGFGELTVDLVQSRELERLIVLAYSESGAALSWDGTLVVQTYGGARVEVPLHRSPDEGVLVPLSLFNIDGEFVLRAEQSLIGGSIREATAAYGFESISWLDDHTALS
ncbi:MAG: hypothetical protein ABI903_10080 [Actinomycetota bacterium]